jgi:ABC-type Fe3+ transport system permease subunit
LFRDLQQPEYLHVLLNHVPITGLAIAALGLAIALFGRSRRATVCALAMIAVCSAAAWPVYLTGKASYRTVRKIADDRGTDWLDEHMERADSWAIAYAAVFCFLQPESLSRSGGKSCGSRLRLQRSLLPPAG